MPTTRHPPHPAGPKHVGVREFRTNLTSYLEGGEPLVISNKGKTVGYFTPAFRTASPEAARKATKAFKKIQASVERAGLTERDLDET